MDSVENIRALLPAFEQLADDCVPLWGRMSPQRMIEHLIDSLRMSRGIPALPLIVDEQRAAAGKRFLLSERALPHNVDNPLMAPERPLHYSSLAEAAAVLAGEVEEFYRFFENNPAATHIHPFFGELSFGEWVVFHKKHFRHHCEQFGLIHSQTPEQQ